MATPSKNKKRLYVYLYCDDDYDDTTLYIRQLYSPMMRSLKYFGF